METLKQILEAYRNKDREFPSYCELAALVAEWEAEQARKQEISIHDRIYRYLDRVSA